LVPKLVWRRVKLVADLRPGEVTETEVARVERDEHAGIADLGLRLTETKQLMAALQDHGEQGYYPVTFRSLFGDVPVRVRRLLTCPCQGQGGAKSFAALDLGNDAIAPELAYVTARYAALASFGLSRTCSRIPADSGPSLVAEAATISLPTVPLTHSRRQRQRHSSRQARSSQNEDIVSLNSSGPDSRLAVFPRVSTAPRPSP
jgi:hypothetical protein